MLSLHDIGAIKFGEFKLKSGIMSPIYVDLRTIVSFPAIMQLVSDAMWDLVKELNFDLICGVPYTALPIATVMSIQHQKPMVMRRKEAKDYGTKKLIEGVFNAGQTVLVVEDLVTSGMSVFETVQPLNDVELKVSDIVVLVDREQGGRTNLNSNGLNLHSVLTISQGLSVLLKHGRVTIEMANKVKEFIANNQVVKAPVAAAAPAPAPVAAAPAAPTFASLKMTYGTRAAACKSTVAAQLFNIMETKKTNLCVAVDVTSAAQVLALADAIGPFICCLKTHVDIITDFDYNSFVPKLQELAKTHNFVVFEDRKFADIGNTVSLQYKAGVYQIAQWADLVNAHTLPGPGIIQGLSKVGKPLNKGLLLLAEMSSAGSLFTPEYTAKTAQLAVEYSDFVVGFIAQSKLTDAPELIHMTPGVQGGIDGTEAKGDGLGQQYNTPQKVILESGTDVIIVGRGVYEAADPATAAQKYQVAGWNAYLQRVGQQ